MGSHGTSTHNFRYVAESVVVFQLVTARRVALVALYGAVLAHGTWLAAAGVAPVESDPAGVDAGAPVATCVTGGAAIGTASDAPWRVPDAVGMAAVEPGVGTETETFGRESPTGPSAGPSPSTP